MSLVVTLLIIALVAVVAFFIVQQLPFDAKIKQIVSLIVGVIILIWLLKVILPLAGVDVPM
jgi:hypothetical protein